MKRFPSLQSDIAAAANDSLERFRDESRKTVLRLVEMESTYLTVEFFRKLHLEPEKNSNPPPNPSGPNLDRYTENYFRRIGKQFSGCIYINCNVNDPYFGNWVGIRVQFKPCVILLYQMHLLMFVFKVLRLMLANIVLYTITGLLTQNYVKAINYSFKRQCMFDEYILVY